MRGCGPPTWERPADAPALLIPGILGGLLLVALGIRRTYGKVWLFRTIFGTDTPAGKSFDVVLLVAIVLSVLTVVIESDPVLRVRHDRLFDALEWFFTLLSPSSTCCGCCASERPCAMPAASSGWWICSRSCPAFWACW